MSEYENERDAAAYYGEDILKSIFLDLDRGVIFQMINCTDIYDIPTLLELVLDLTVEEAVVAIRKTPPPYEKKSLFILDKVFQAVNSCGEGLLVRAEEKMMKEGNVPEHFAPAYERFKEILKDEEILSSLYPQAKFQ